MSPWQRFCAPAAVWFSFAQVLNYKRSIKLLVGQGNTVDYLGNNIQGLQQLTPTIVEAVKTRAETALLQERTLPGA